MGPGFAHYFIFYFAKPAFMMTTKYWIKPFLAFLCALMLSSSAKAQGEVAPSDEADTTVILRKLARWDTSLSIDSKAQTFTDIWGYESKDGREYAIMGGKANTYFIDITQPRNPELVAKKPGRGQEAIHRDYATYKHYCYAVTDEVPGALRIYDLQYLPDSVPLVYDSTEYSVFAHNIFCDNQRLYLSSNDRFQEGYPLTVLSIKNPENPSLLDNLNPDSVKPKIDINDVHDTYVKDDTVYASAGWKGFYIIDYTNPKQPELIAKIVDYPFKGYNHSSWLTPDGQTMVMADETHGLPLKVFEINNLKNPEYQAPIGVNTEAGSIPHNPLIKGDLAYISYYHEGLQVFDISNPGNPTKLVSDDTYPQYKKDTIEGYQGCWGVYPFFSSGVVAASDMSNGLFLYRIDTVISDASKTFNLKAKTSFQNQIDIRVDLYEAQSLELALYNMQGQRVGQKVTPFWEEGEEFVTWNQLGDLGPGLYFLKGSNGGETQVKRMFKAR